MPKILIHEKDLTSPGTQDGYENFAVLVTGFAVPALKPKNVKPDIYGVYEFKNAQDFKDTIGLVAPKVVDTDVNNTTTCHHYGNQMAYELLKMGYPVVYKPIQSASDLADANFWEIFKDKSSYDFRFITHGLLESFLPASVSNEVSTKDYRKGVVNAAIAALSNIEMEANNKHNTETKVTDDPAPEPSAEWTDCVSNLYSELLNNTDDSTKNAREGLTVLTTGEYYDSYENAKKGTSDELKELETAIKNLTAKYVTNGLIHTANEHIANLAAYSNTVNGRGDCIALIEVDETKYNTGVSRPEISIIQEINAMTGIREDNGAYCAATVPSVVYKMSNNDLAEFGDNKKFPGAFHYLACFANSLQSGFAEWYAAAGYTRGVSSYTIDYATAKFGEIAINALEPRNRASQESNPKFSCNVIANFRGSYYLWGNRTAAELKSPDSSDGDLKAKHFLNIRQLCTTIKKQLYVACRRFTFDPNSDVLWVNFVNAIKPTLDAMKADQGIRDYKILKVYEEDPKKATLKARIRIIPIEAVEDFDITVSLEDSFGETAVITN